MSSKAFRKYIFGLLIAFCLVTVACDKPAENPTNLDNSDIVGRYITLDGDVQGSSLELYENYSYKRVSNYCQGFEEFIGTYTVTENGQEIVVSLLAVTSAGEEVAGSGLKFNFNINSGTLSLIEGGVEGGVSGLVIDCSNAKVFVKDTGDNNVNDNNGKDNNVSDNNGTSTNKPKVTSQTYYAVDPDSNKKMKGSYIELFSDGTFVHKFNMCEGYHTIKGTYKTDMGDLTITRKSGSDQYKKVYFYHDGETLELAIVYYGNGTQATPDDENFWFDCTYSIIFRK